jgi:hypothetical protein
MAEQTTIKVSGNVLGEIQRRAERLGMTKGTYTDRLLRMALETTKSDAVEEFKLLEKYKEVTF